jgi:hypothetical protein
MKHILIALTASFIVLGCEKNDIDTTPPPPPQGIITISLDNAVEIQWLPSQAEDVKGYKVWKSDHYAGRYQLIASTSNTRLVDYGAVNGITYYYAVSAYDFNENESALSKDVVYDTPRPEGVGVVLIDTSTARSLSGYGFAQYSVLSCYDKNTDIFLVDAHGRLYIQVWSDTDIQDMGYTSSLDAISASPTEGWAPSKSAEAIMGHTYVIWTVDDYYAKVRVQNVTTNRIVFDWAYQTAKGNIELKLVHSPRTGGRQLGRIQHSLVK